MKLPTVFITTRRSAGRALERFSAVSIAVSIAVSQPFLLRKWWGFPPFSVEEWFRNGRETAIGTAIETAEKRSSARPALLLVVMNTVGSFIRMRPSIEEGDASLH
jgi:hypothetical protein